MTAIVHNYELGPHPFSLRQLQSVVGAADSLSFRKAVEIQDVPFIYVLASRLSCPRAGKPVESLGA